MEMTTTMKQFESGIRSAIIRANGTIMNPSTGMNAPKGRRIPPETVVYPGDIVLVCGIGNGYPYSVSAYIWEKDGFGEWGFRREPSPIKSRDPRWIEATSNWA